MHQFLLKTRGMIRFIAQLWLLGMLILLAGIGYLFYFFLMLVRIVQMNVSKPILIALVSLIALTGLIILFEFNPPSFVLGKPTLVRVDRGMSLKAVSELLVTKKVILNKQLFYYYMRATKQSDKILAGSYRIRRNSGVIRAAKMITDPNASGVKIQIREGLTFEQISQVIDSQYDINTERFDSLCVARAFIDSLGFEGDTSLEGYLFPNTYMVSYGSTEADIIGLMTKEFWQTYNGLVREGRGASFSRKELVTMASIVEKEAAVPSERPRISAVFHNRLEQGIPLGADPTIRYAFKKYSGPLLQSELRDQNLYNTRIHKGLTPTPICSPGKAAMEAAMKPLTSDELFFIAKWDGSGEHYFSRTNEEHEALKEKVRKERKDLSNW